jgi:ATP-dependent RNA helicase RhlE
MSYYSTTRTRGRTSSRRPGNGSRPTQRQNNRGGRKKYINPASFVQAATAQSSEVYTPTNRFTDFELIEILQRNLAAKGYETPSPIQDQVIIPAIIGQDIIGIASTGTGKTAAFALPILNKLVNNRNSKAIIIAPTRELAEQIEQEFKALGKGTGLLGVLLIGGTNMTGQLRTLKEKPELVIGTPGRIKDHLQRGTLNLSGFDTVVLDEVDRMLDMGFVNDVTEILSSTNPNRQSLFFSATIDQKVRTLIQTFSDNPFVVSLKPTASSENVHQDVVTYGGSHEKMEKLHDLLTSRDVSKAIVFDETQRSVERLEKELRLRGFQSGSIHGGKTQGQRKRALDSFKRNEITILVATDVAARGIDVSDITHVINYSTPDDYEAYVHRIGRTGRAGRIGHALTFVPR